MSRYDVQLSALSVLSCFLVGCSPGVDNARRTTSVSAQASDAGVEQVDVEPTAAIPDAIPNQPAVKPTATGEMSMGKMKFPASKDMKFRDGAKSNVKLPESISELVFTSKDGSEIKVADYIGEQHLILVFTEGFNGMLCPFCKTQTSRLVANYDEFKRRNCEVIVVYPGPDDHLDEFVEAALKTEKAQVDKVPFPIVLDRDFSATDYFDIHSMHAHPSTYLVDIEGSVKFAYVGKDMTADRPSVKTMLEKLDQLEFGNELK